MLAAREFLLIMGLGLIVAGLTTYVITWVLVLVHLRDHHPAERARLGASPFRPGAALWYLRARYRALRDVGLNALAVPGCIGVWAILAGIAATLVSKGLAFVGSGA